MKDIKQLRAKGKTLEPIVRIGKQGITDTVVEEVKLHLKKKKMIKVKLLSNVAKKENKKALAEELAERTNSEIIEQVGFVVVLHKKTK